MLLPASIQGKKYLQNGLFYGLCPYGCPFNKMEFIVSPYTTSTYIGVFISYWEFTQN